MLKIYEWINKEKQRFYTITVYKKDDDSILLKYKWGAMHSNKGGNKDIVATEHEAEHYITQMLKRRKYRGYELVKD